MTGKTHKYWTIDAGNSSTGQVGFVLRGIRAETKEQALEIGQTMLPEDMQEDVRANVEERDSQPHAHLSIYFNTGKLTLADVSEDDMEDYDDDDDN